MTSATIATTSAEPRIERYRLAERALWNRYGLEPTERFVHLDSPAVRLRVLEVGSGEPVLFVHGTAGPGSWPSLIRDLPGFRCLVLDRPGWGLSSALDFSRYEYKTVVADVLEKTLDALGVERAHVVGGSIGNVWALRLAARTPSRVDRIVLMGGSPLVPEAGVPRIIRLIASPIGALMVRFPDSPRRLRSIMRQSGHGASLNGGLIPDEFIEWRVTLGRETDTMRNERNMIRALVSGREYRPGLTFVDSELAAIEQPTLYVYGTADPVGSVAVWTRAVGVLPRGELQLVDGAGHMPWFDDPGQIAGKVNRFLTQ